MELSLDFHEVFNCPKLRFIFLAIGLKTVFNILKKFVWFGHSFYRKSAVLSFSIFLSDVAAVIPGWLTDKSRWYRGSPDQKKIRLSEEDKTKHGVFQEASQPLP